MIIEDTDILSFTNPTEWQIWLEKHHTESTGVWVRFYKKNVEIKSIVYAEALDVALCYGWIDSQVKKYDEVSYIQKFTPRREKSIWSKNNREHIERLIKEGKMKPAGLLQVEKAKQDGRWDNAYDSPSNATLPDDFLHELEKNTKAKVFYSKLNKANMYAIIWRLQTAKKPETRKKRMKVIINMLIKGEAFHP